MDDFDHLVADVNAIPDPVTRARRATLLGYLMGWMHWGAVRNALDDGLGYPYPEAGPGRADFDREVSHRVEAVERGWEFAREALWALDRLPARLERAGNAASMHP